MYSPTQIISLILMMPTASTSTGMPLGPGHTFAVQAHEVKAPKSDINALILDYLTVAGYPNAAAKFSSEANLQPQQPTPAIQQRHRIRTLIHKGEIEHAIKELNESYPSILDGNDSLLFALLRLQLVELIRSCNNSPDRDISVPLKFAQTMLGPRAAKKTEFLEDLERTMSLLVFPQDHTLDPSLSALLQPNLRRDVADRVNQAILESQRQRKETAIRQLVQMRAWSEDAVRKDPKKDLPASIELRLDTDDAGQGDAAQNGHEPMITT
ncbi:ran binding protein in the microtubule-organising centre [Xylaria sp. CBS 124048]|nr:ran binding protein in the microtubule-organising centre [Xylaria sp. CBS 124048]